ncbi:angiopoietin-related protein 2-like [Anoplophora glabripennis]|uniref:angiopoietin-related protein 2-like n=1 Tax=Anoplophora glabripennis TaxID=217634 RepID=UPI000C76DDEA|nr:angiopoietin-related protein 2-like [Anoplophora glabripennis]
MLKAEFGTMKNTIKVLSDQWEKWNTLFLTSLEPRISSTASTLASIDSNIHNLQERAHVWDTFQLHVSAWNEQLASLDRKVDIISKGQEKVLNLDGKINAMEYKLDNTLKILNSIQDSVGNLDTTVYSKKSQDVLFNEFATRGILSSIKLVEKKLDRLLILNQNNLLKKVTDEKPKLTIKCNTPRILEDLLNDISSKVDVIFDNISSTRDEDDDSEYDGDYLNVSEGSGVEIDAKNQSQKKRLRKAIRKIMLPCKHTNQALEEILNRSIRIENTSLIILDKENTHFEKLSKDSSECKPVVSIGRQSQEITRHINLILDSYFSEQRAHFESISNKLTKRYCGSKPETYYNLATPQTPTYSTTKQKSTYADVFAVATTSSTLHGTSEGRINETTNAKSFENSIETNNPLPTWTPIMDQNKSSCEDLDRDDSSGVYIFGNNVEGTNTELFFNKRYCEIRDDGWWTVVQRRDNYNVQNNFNVSWDNYKYGFGNLHRDFWMGNDFLSSLSNNFSLTLRIELEDFENHSAWAEYNTFRISPEADNYRLTIGGYSGNATDSFSGHNDSQFSTYDKINDAAPECCPCAVSYGGGWWFNRCFESNLNGIYYKRPNENDYFRGIIWEHWLGNYSLKKTVMMVKSRSRTYPENYPSPKFPDTETIPYYEDP